MIDRREPRGREIDQLRAAWRTSVTPSRIGSCTQTTRASARERVVELAQRRRLLGAVVVALEHAAAPERVVEDHQAALGEQRQAGLEVRAVVRLVGVDEDEVERAVELRDRLQRRTAADLDAVRVGAGVDVALGEVGVLLRELAADDLPAGGSTAAIAAPSSRSRCRARAPCARRSRRRASPGSGPRPSP